MLHATNSVLGKRRNLLGYVDVATLKKKWEAGEVNPVSAVQCVVDSFSGNTDSQSVLLLLLLYFYMDV